MRTWLRRRSEEEDPGIRKRRRPAFFLQALLTEDIPPYLVNQRGEKLSLADDPIAAKHQESLDTDPASL